MRFPFDLHVLGTPPTFILSQDQTLRILQGSNLYSVEPTILLLMCTAPQGQKRREIHSHHRSPRLTTLRQSVKASLWNSLQFVSLRLYPQSSGHSSIVIGLVKGNFQSQLRASRNKMPCAPQAESGWGFIGAGGRGRLKGNWPTWARCCATLCYWVPSAWRCNPSLRAARPSARPRLSSLLRINQSLATYSHSGWR